MSNRAIKMTMSGKIAKMKNGKTVMVKNRQIVIMMMKHIGNHQKKLPKSQKLKKIQLKKVPNQKRLI